MKKFLILIIGVFSMGGLSVSGNPLFEYAHAENHAANYAAEDLPCGPDGRPVLRPGQDMEYRYPLDLDVSFSGTYGELRTDHFHTGLDMRIGGVTGAEVHAAADGYVSRISISPTGYGNALYITHPNGQITVYGHLLRFAGGLQEYAVGKQHEACSFAVELFPQKEEFPVKKGQVIAYAGNSGSSGGPHLHFEVRDSASSVALNSIKRGYVKVHDDIPPYFKGINFYSYDSLSLSVRELHAFGNPFPEETLELPEYFYVAADVYDKQNNTFSKLGIDSLVVTFDGEPFYVYVNNEYPFQDGKYINSFIEYHAFEEHGRSYLKTMRDPGNRLSGHCYYKNDGIMRIRDTLVHDLVLTAIDEHGNRSSAAFRVRKGEVLFQDARSAADAVRGETVSRMYMDWSLSSLVLSDSLKLFLPENALYNSIICTVKKISMPDMSGYEMNDGIAADAAGGSRFLSSAYSVHDSHTALNRMPGLAIAANADGSVEESKLMLARIDTAGRKIAGVAGCYYRNGFVYGRIPSFGVYAVMADTCPPLIQGGFSDNPSHRAAFRITDDTGISSYKAEVDGEWALASYDAKNDMLTVDFSYLRAGRENKRHVLVITVSDLAGNVSECTGEFYY